MEITQVYALATGSIFFCLFLFRIRRYIRSFLKTVNLQASQYLIYPQLIYRHRFIGPWSWADILSQLSYIGVNVFCIGFNAPSVHAANLRAADLSLINMIPAFAGPHLSFLADILGLPLTTYRRVHRSFGVMSCFLLSFQVFTTIASRISFPLHQAENLWGLVGALSICLLLLFSHPFLWKISYEVFLRAHQSLAVLSAYSIWRHLGLKTLWPKHYLFPQLYVYMFTWTFLCTFLLQLGTIVYRNWPTKLNCSQAYITHINDTVKIHLTLSQPLRVKPEQYICLWFPTVTVSFRSFFQSHPFTVTSWSEQKQDSLDLLVEPRRGFTQRLLDYSKAAEKAGRSASPCLALFSGPHGTSASVGKYETVLMVATGFGIAAQLPYLKKLIYGYNSCTTRTRRVHLVWQLETIDIEIAVQSFLNDALADDTLDEGYILGISIYIKIGKVDSMPFGRRAILYNGSADFRAILEEEMSGKYIKRVQGEKPGDMLVMVSAMDKVRDHLRGIVRDHLNDHVRLLELEYQPAMNLAPSPGMSINSKKAIV